MNEKKLKERLKDVKRLLGKDEGELAFVGVANVAEYRWCAQKSVFSNREMELAYFEAFLYDVVYYAEELGYIRGADRVVESITAEELMELRDKITLDDVNYLLKKREEAKRKLPFSMIEIPHGFLNREEAAELLGALAPSPRVFEIIRKLPPDIQGEILHQIFTEKYATIRWNFPWREYIVAAIPDGITDSYVYEFKATVYPGAVKYVALAQADIYGYFFKRPEKLVQLLHRRGYQLETFRGPVDAEYALETLEKFRAVEKGLKEPEPPKEWKCKSCEYRQICPIYAKRS